jgi:hypothetical protein
MKLSLGCLRQNILTLQADEVGVLVEQPLHHVLAPRLQGCRGQVLQLCPAHRGDEVVIVTTIQLAGEILEDPLNVFRRKAEVMKWCLWLSGAEGGG